MDKLLQPDTGLMVWTVVMFLCLLAILTKAAWKPILDGLAKRESRIKSDLERAEKANQDAAALKSQFEAQLAEAQKTIQGMMAEAKADGEKTRSQMLAVARNESDKLVEEGRKDLLQEAEKLKSELKTEVAGLAVMVAEKALQKSMDDKLREKVLKDSLQEITGAKS